MKTLHRILLLVVLIGLFSAPSHAIAASTETNDFIEPLPIVVDFPNSITFKGRLLRTVKIADLKLYYNIERRECIKQFGMAQPYSSEKREAETGYAGDIVEWTWPLALREIGPGTPLEWGWGLGQLEGGAPEYSGSENAVISDTRYQWKSAKSKNIEVFMASFDNKIAKEILTTGEDTIKYLENFVTDIPSKRYEIYVYPSVKEFEAIYRTNVLGTHLMRSDKILTGFSISEWNNDAIYRSTIPHEITHAVLAESEFFCDQEIPKWFIEGFAGYIDWVMVPEATPKFERSAYIFAAQKNGMFSLESWSVDPKQVTLYYIQSKYIFQYLIDDYGAKKPHEIRNLITTDVDFAMAFERIYGFSLEELETKFVEKTNRNLPVDTHIPLPQRNKKTELQSTTRNTNYEVVPMTVKAGTTYKDVSIIRSPLVVALSIVVLSLLMVLAKQKYVGWKK